MVAEAVGPRGRRRVRHAPWSAEQAARLLVSNLGALAGILATAYGAASADDTQTALLWFNLSVASLAFAGAANALWLVRCHSITSTRRADVLDEVTDTIRLPQADLDRTPHTDYVVVPGADALPPPRLRVRSGSRGSAGGGSGPDRQRTCPV